jgi:microcystin-dependent protein
MDDYYLGTIAMCAFNFTPNNFAACNGATLQVSQNAALYSLIGNTFGGSAPTTFGLPDLRGRVAVNVGTAPGGSINWQMGETIGNESMALTKDQLPSHNHAIQEVQSGRTVTATAAAAVNASDALGDVPNPSGKYWAKVNSGSGALPGYHNSKDVTMASDAVQVTVTPAFNASNLITGNTGSGAAVPLFQPTLAINFVICTNGLYPTRQ